MLIRLFHDKSNKDRPWSVRVEEPAGIAHYPASKVYFHVPSWTEANPDANTSQKYYMVADGKLEWQGPEAHVR
jgi:hypothetical protein